MLNRLRKLRSLWKLTKEHPNVSIESIELIGKTEFLSDMTKEEMDDYIKKNEQGWGNFYKKLREKL